MIVSSSMTPPTSVRLLERIVRLGSVNCQMSDDSLQTASWHVRLRRWAPPQRLLHDRSQDRTVPTSGTDTGEGSCSSSAARAVRLCGFYPPTVVRRAEP